MTRTETPRGRDLNAPPCRRRGRRGAKEKDEGEERIPPSLTPFFSGEDRGRRDRSEIPNFFSDQCPPKAPAARTLKKHVRYDRNRVHGGSSGGGGDRDHRECVDRPVAYAATNLRARRRAGDSRHEGGGGSGSSPRGVCAGGLADALHARRRFLSLKPRDQQALDGQLSVATPTAKHVRRQRPPPPVSDYVLSSSSRWGGTTCAGRDEALHEDTNLPKQTPCNTIGLPMNPLQADSYEREHSRDFLHDARKAEPQGSAFLDELFPPLATA